MKDDNRSYRRNFCAVAKRKTEKIEACTGFEPLTSAIPVQRSYKFSQQANWEQVVELVRYKPWNDDDESYEYMKIIYVNCRVKN